MIRVLIVDDQGMVRAGLERLIGAADDLEVVATAADGREAVTLCERHAPDVVLMDLEMPELDGREATRQILAARPQTRVVVLTSFSDRERILGALDAGAVGYLLKDTEPEDLINGVRTAARGESPINPRAASQLLAARAAERPAERRLSDRERDVLTLVARGQPNKLIARELGISEKTVKAHITSIFQQLGVTDRTQAALWAHRTGWVKD